MNSRLRRVSWDELQTRALQAIDKRLDLLRRPALESALTGDVEQQNASRTGKFFFAPEDVPQIGQILRRHLSHEVDRIVDDADQICRHRFRLLGYPDLDFGSPIDWHLDPVHQKRAPLKPWYRIPYLDFSKTGDHKIIWELNRHQHLVTLAKAFVLTGKDRYVIEIVTQWYAWQQANPFPRGINWCSSLEVAFRSLSWLWVRALVGHCALVSAKFKKDLLQALAQNAEFIERYLSTYFSPNTHLIGEAAGLFFIGTLCPQIAGSTSWRDRGWQILLQESDRQVRPDGSHFEQSLYYHVYALDFFLHARALAELNGIGSPKSFDQTLQKMLAFVRVLSQAGPPAAFGDDDGGRVFNPRRNRSEYLRDPLAGGAVLFPDLNLKSSASLTEEAVWLFGKRAIDCLTGSAAPVGSESIGFVDAGIFVTTDPTPRGAQMVIDAGRMGAGRAGHSHADALGVALNFSGRQWLVDSGTCCYASDRRNEFRGTLAHNTLSIDGQNQAVPDGPFRWRALPEVRAERWISGRSFSLLRAINHGCSRRPSSVAHRRIVFHLHECFWLIVDCALGAGLHRLRTSWHFASDSQLENLGAAFVAKPIDDRSGHSALALFPDADCAWTGKIERGELSPAYGETRSCDVLRMSSNATLPAQCAMLLQPIERRVPASGKLSRIRGAPDSISIYEYVQAGVIHRIMFAGSERPWSFGNWSSDASFLYSRSAHDELARIIMCDGSFIDFDGERIAACERKLDWFEAIHDRGGGSVFASDPQAVRFSMTKAMPVPL